MKVRPSQSQLATLMHWFNFPAMPGYSSLLPITFDTETETFEVLTSVVLIRRTHHLPVAFDKIGGNFVATHNGLRSFVGFPQTVEGICDCRFNNLRSMEHAPQIVGSNFFVSNNHITNMNGFPQEIGGIVEIDYDPMLPLLQTLKAKGGVEINAHSRPAVKKTDYQKMESILNKYAGTGKKGMLHAAAELTKAGYKENARW
jgi:hypothetical protein